MGIQSKTLLVGGVGVAAGMGIWLRLSPVPWVAGLRILGRRAGRREAADIARRTAPFVPAGIVEFLDHPYLPGTSAARLDVFRPLDSPGPLPTVVWVHGGGWIAGTKDGLRDYFRVLAGRGFTVIGVDYTLAPRGRFPQQVHEVAAAVRHVVDSADELGADPTRLVLCGDSAGAQIAACLANVVTNPSYAEALGVTPPIEPPALTAAALFCGAFVLNADVRAATEASRLARLLLWAYLGTRDGSGHPVARYASVGEHLSPAFPPALVSAGNGDPLLPQSRRLVAALEEAGVVVDTLFFDDDHEPTVPHEYQVYLDTDEGLRALEALVAHLMRYTR